MSSFRIATAQIAVVRGKIEANVASHVTAVSGIYRAFANGVRTGSGLISFEYRPHDEAAANQRDIGAG